MKTLLRLIAFVICARCFGADAANDIILVQRKSDNSGPVQRNVAPVATGLIGTDGSKVPAPITIGANLTLSGSPLTLSASVSGGSGNVTNNATLASGNIVIGGGTTVVGTTNISVSGGNNISNVGTINVTTINATTLTSSTASANGQVPIWNVTNGNFTIATLTQGANVTITNTAGAITIAGNYNGNVTSAAALTANAIVLGNGTTTEGAMASLGSSGQILRSAGAGTPPIWSTPTYPNTATANKILVGDGTNIVLSTPTFPNASATSGKVIKSDGTNWVASTETYAAPGTSGNILVSDGTNWTSNATITYATHLGTFASPNTAAGAITWTSPVYNIYTSAGSTRTYTLPAASSYSGQAFILNVAVGTGHVNVQPASGAALVLAGVLLTADHYVQATTSAPGNYICFISDGTNWTSLGSSGTWSDAASQ